VICSNFCGRGLSNLTLNGVLLKLGADVLLLFSMNGITRLEFLMVELTFILMDLLAQTLSSVKSFDHGSAL